MEKINRVYFSVTDCCALFQYLWEFLIFYEKKKEKTFSNVS